MPQCSWNSGSPEEWVFSKPGGIAGTSRSYQRRRPNPDIDGPKAVKLGGNSEKLFNNVVLAGSTD